MRMINKQAFRPVDRRKLDAEWEHERDKQRTIQVLIGTRQSYNYDIIATVKGAIECADHFVYTSSLTTGERRSMQKRLNRFIVSLAD